MTASYHSPDLGGQKEGRVAGRGSETPAQLPDGAKGKLERRGVTSGVPSAQLAAQPESLAQGFPHFPGLLSSGPEQWDA